MNKNTVAGKAKELAGRTQREVGRVTRNRKMQAKGVARQAEGKVQGAVGKLEDAADSRARLDGSSRRSTPRTVRVTRTKKTTTVRRRAL